MYFCFVMEGCYCILVIGRLSGDQLILLVIGRLSGGRLWTNFYRILPFQCL
ncbi:hypothetical protein MANES_11G146800v8 [Manihot esculenta]|uniref:Uncharacterized protein n=1 Tax=Manihot esculenta TaxID=3983 RepID=A0A2C9V1G9_MANES|nr:hypothetical protein MANES_11G146800v8 [Manihot esculenta]